jgi:hypothetical protein
VVTSEGGVIIMQEEEKKADQNDSSFMDRVMKVNALNPKSSANFTNLSQ